MSPEEQMRQEHDAQATAEELVRQLGKFANGMRGIEFNAFATALANEHPTLLGQIAKAVGVAVMRRAVYDGTWRPYDRYERFCPANTNKSAHAEHDGRLDCDTVIGAELMARQSFI